MSRRPVLRAVVGRDDEVDAGVQVERDLRVDRIRLVAGPEGHDELHSAAPRAQLRWTAALRRRPVCASRELRGRDALPSAPNVQFVASPSFTSAIAESTAP